MLCTSIAAAVVTAARPWPCCALVPRARLCTLQAWASRHAAAFKYPRSYARGLHARPVLPAPGGSSATAVVTGKCGESLRTFWLSCESAPPSV